MFLHVFFAFSSFQENMEKPLPCFKGYSPRSLLSLLDMRFETGYPVGDLSSQVEEHPGPDETKRCAEGDLGMLHLDP